MSPGKTAAIEFVLMKDILYLQSNLQPLLNMLCQTLLLNPFGPPFQTGALDLSMKHCQPSQTNCG